MAHVKDVPPNCRVTLTTLNGATFTGTLQPVNFLTGKVILKSVTTAGVKLFGPQHFHCSQIIDLQFLEEFQDVVSGGKKSSGKNGKLSFGAKKMHQYHLSRFPQLDTDDLAMSSIFAEDNGDQGIGSAEEDFDNDFEDFYETKDYTLICRISEKFYDTIVHIMEQEVVGLSFEGVDIGRQGTLSVIQVATKDSLFIFDMLRLGEEALKEGLQALFESEDVLKVIHDCRWLSDMIHNKYNMYLANVFDTQVANAFVYRSINGGDWPRYVDSLPGCLVSHLHLSPERAHFMKVRDKAREKDQSVWLQRPLPEKLLVAASRDVTYLIELYKVLSNKLLLEFRTGVEVYMHHVANMRGEIEKCRNSRHLLPYAFTDLQKLVNFNFSDTRDSNIMRDSRGFRENHIDITDKQIVFSHDSVWHRSKEYMAQIAQAKDKKCQKKNTPAEPCTGGRKQSEHSKDTVQVSGKVKASESSVECSKDSSLSSANIHTCQQGKLPDAQSQHNFSALMSPDKNTKQSALKSFRGVEKVDSTKKAEFDPSSKDGSHLDSSLKENTQDLVKPGEVSDKIQKSKLWQTFHAKKIGLITDSSIVDNPENRTPSTDEKVPTEDGSNSKLEIEAVEDVVQKLEKLRSGSAIKPHHLPSSSSRQLKFDQVPAFSVQSRKSPTSSTSSGISRSSGGTPSDNDGIVTFPKPREADILREQNFSVSAMIPAGFHRAPMGRKKAKRMQEQMLKVGSDSDVQLIKKTAVSHSAEEEDFAYIPMQPSLRRQKEVPLGMSDFGVGDFLSEDESILSHCDSKAYIQRRLAFNDESSIRDQDIESFQQSETFQKILKLASASSKGSLKKKLLPSKLTSPSPGN